MKNKKGFLVLLVIKISIAMTTILTAQQEGNLSTAILEWEVSQPFPATQIDLKVVPYPRFYTIFAAEWQKVTADSTGIMDITNYVQKAEGQPTCVLVRTIFRSDTRQDMRIAVSYNDEIAIYFNGKKLFYGKSGGNNKGQSILKAMTANEMVYFTQEKGLNEIFFIIKENGGDWGFIANTDDTLVQPLKEEGRLEKVWETAQVFLTPESVLYDSKREVLYVSNFDNRYNPNTTDPEEFSGYISKVSLDGEIIALQWISNLHAPCGMGVFENKLYTVERGFLTEIDIDAGRILNRYPIPGSDFLNDLTIDTEGNIYMTDTSPTSRPDSRIYKFSKGKITIWADGEDINWANGLSFYNNRLLLGNSGDGCLKSIDIASQKIEKIACLGAGVVDGIRVTTDGNFLVSHWEGQVYLISPNGKVVELMDKIGRYNTADFEYIQGENLLIIPTFVDNRIMAYRFH